MIMLLALIACFLMVVGICRAYVKDEALNDEMKRIRKEIAEREAGPKH